MPGAVKVQFLSGLFTERLLAALLFLSRSGWLLAGRSAPMASSAIAAATLLLASRSCVLASNALSPALWRLAHRR